MPKRGKRLVQNYLQTKGKETTKTKVLVTLNPNKAVMNKKEYDHRKVQLLSILTDFDQDDVQEQVCGSDPYVEKISLKNLSLEVGSKKKRLHAHFILSIKHYVLNYSLKKLRERIKDWLNSNGTVLSKNWYVNLTLAPAFKENYALKEARKEAALNREEENPTELERLSDERQIKTVTLGTFKNKIDVLEGNSKEASYVTQKGHRSYNTKEVALLTEGFEKLGLK